MFTWYFHYRVHKILNNLNIPERFQKDIINVIEKYLSYIIPFEKIGKIRFDKQIIKEFCNEYYQNDKKNWIYSYLY